MRPAQRVVLTGLGALAALSLLTAPAVTGSTVALTATTGLPSPAAPNLVRNPSMETTAAGTPSCWQLGGVGSGLATLGSVRDPHSGSLAAVLVVSTLSGGNRKVVIDQQAAGCAPAATAGHRYSISIWYHASAPVHLSSYFRDAAGVWQYSGESANQPASASWRRITWLTGTAPKGTTALSFGPVLSRPGTLTADDAAAVDAGSAPAPAAGPLFADGFGVPDGLITNEYAYWNPGHAGAHTSPDWVMTSGSLFASGGSAVTGRVDDVSPNAASTNGTDSAVFRLNTRRSDFGDVTVSLRLDVRALASTPRTPAVAWDGAHVWLRYQSQYSLYAVSVARRDGRVVIKKKCPGGPSNDGTYYQLGAELPGFPIPLGSWRVVSATARTNPDGSVTLSAAINGRAVDVATDRGTGCAPITRAGAAGLRGDNAEMSLDDFTVTSAD